MEGRGKINQYTPYKWRGDSFFVINLANGVTPFMHVFDGKEYSSNCYRLELGLNLAIIVTHAHYRPTREEFDQLGAGVYGKALQDHFLNGGLHIAELHNAKQLPDDPVETTWDYETCQAWWLAYYGRRLGPLGK